jgi:tRNA A-37 threonylcarbamoyl transferase component Bud32
MNQPQVINDRFIIKLEKKCIIWKDYLDSGTPVVIKIYRDMNFINYIRKKCFGFRVQREYNALKKLTEQNIQCSKPISWNYGFSPRYGFYEQLITEEIKDSKPLTNFLSQCSEKSNGVMNLQPLFFAIKDMHQKGIFHGHLRPKNILVKKDKSGNLQYFFIDMPHARFFSRPIHSIALAVYDLVQLITKLESRWGFGFCRSPLATCGYKFKDIERIYNDPSYLYAFDHSKKVNKFILNGKIFLSGIFHKYTMKQ